MALFALISIGGSLKSTKSRTFELTNYLLVISLNLYLVLIVFSGLLKGRDAVWDRKTNSLVQHIHGADD